MEYKEYKEYGYWSEDGSEYVITERKTPRHWYNYLFNDTYNAFASQVGFGEGFCQDDMGNRVELVADRCLYIVDKEKGSWHTANGLPMWLDYQRYECHHGLGYTTYFCEKDGIASEYTMFVPREGDFEQWIVKITNKREQSAKLGVIAYAATNTDGVYTPQGYTSQAGDWDEKSGAICHRVSTNIYTKQNSVTCSYMACDSEISAYDNRKSAFIGIYGDKENPESLETNNGCTNSASCTEKLCFALETACMLSAGESRTVCFQIGHVMKKEDVSEAKQFLMKGMPQKLLKDVITYYKQVGAGVKIQTPDEKLNLAFNSFYQYATDMGSRWARVRHNGYRDMVFDTESLATFHPVLAKERFLRELSYQYAEGNAPRTFKDGKIQLNNYMDCAVWLPMLAHTLINELGDVELLKIEVKFNDGTSATVFEHLRRAMQHIYDSQGHHGLIKIWGGDWNDGMNWAGLDGKGVSVWLSIAWCRANSLFIELAELLGETELAKTHKEMGEVMRQRIEEYGFDKDHYITAINDDGKKIGAWESDACKMWLNPQTWAVMAEIAPKEKLLSVMEVVDDYLECPYGTKINRPAYTECDTKMGNFTRQPAGTLLNESVYLQPMGWKIMADAILGRREQMQRTIEKLLPWNHKYGVTYGEPYILYNFYHTDEAGYRAGTPGQSWRTATAQCFTKAMIRYVYGLVPTMEGLRLEPCLPPDWETCGITKDFRGCRYEICYHQLQNSEGIIERICVNGKEITGNLLPYETGMEYQVELFIK